MIYAVIDTAADPQRVATVKLDYSLRVGDHIVLSETGQTNPEQVPVYEVTGISAVVRPDPDDEPTWTEHYITALVRRVVPPGEPLFAFR